VGIVLLERLLMEQGFLGELRDVHPSANVWTVWSYTDKSSLWFMAIAASAILDMRRSRLHVVLPVVEYVHMCHPSERHYHCRCALDAPVDIAIHYLAVYVIAQVV
jgi:hypothetical protein